MGDVLIEITWKAPIATAVRDILGANGIAPTTANLPGAVSRGFFVVDATQRAAVDELARSLRAAGAEVTIVVA
jgi:hypothetical protein